MLLLSRVAQGLVCARAALPSRTLVCRLVTAGVLVNQPCLSILRVRALTVPRRQTPRTASDLPRRRLVALLRSRLRTRTLIIAVAHSCVAVVVAAAPPGRGRAAAFLLAGPPYHSML